MDTSGLGSSYQWKFMEIYGNLSISIEIQEFIGQKVCQLVSPCGGKSVATCGGRLNAPKKLLQAGRPRIIRSSDGGIIG